MQTTLYSLGSIASAVHLVARILMRLRLHHILQSLRVSGNGGTLLCL
jgi:hypothetical protein